MALINKSTCTIKNLNDNGLGEADSNAGLIQIPYTLKGELVSYETHKYRKQSNSVLLEVINESKNRIKPECKYFQACGGCLLQHMDKDSYEDFKLSKINNLLKKEAIETKVNPIISINSGERRRANLKVIKKNNQVILGFNKFKSNQIINIDACIALLPELSNILPDLKILSYFLLNEQEKAKIFITKASNGIDVMIEFEHNKDVKLFKDNIISFCEKLSIIKCTLSYNNIENVIYESETPYVLFDDAKVEINSNSFLQSSFSSDKILSNLILEYLKISDPSIKVVDLFCGRGTYTLPVSKLCSVTGFELDELSISSLKKAAKKLKRKIKIEKKNLFNNTLTTLELNKYNYAIINPPRAGANAQCSKLKNSYIQKICYISCNPLTFIEDAKTLINGGYNLVEITPVDQFYWNPHLEVVGYFEKIK